LSKGCECPNEDKRADHRRFRDVPRPEQWNGGDDRADQGEVPHNAEWGFCRGHATDTDHRDGREKSGSQREQRDEGEDSRPWFEDQENADISDANGPLRSRWGWFFQPYPGDDGNKKRRGHMEYDGFGEGDRGKCEEVTVHGSQASG